MDCRANTLTKPALRCSQSVTVSSQSFARFAQRVRSARIPSSSVIPGLPVRLSTQLAALPRSRLAYRNFDSIFSALLFGTSFWQRAYGGALVTTGGLIFVGPQANEQLSAGGCARASRNFCRSRSLRCGIGFLKTLLFRVSLTATKPSSLKNRIDSHGTFTGKLGEELRPRSLQNQVCPGKKP